MQLEVTQGHWKVISRSSATVEKLSPAQPSILPVELIICYQ